EIVDDPDRILEYKKGLEQVKMTEVEKMNEKVRPICLLIDVNEFSFMQPSFELISGPIHLRRIIVLNKSSEHFDIEMQIIDSGSVKIREEYFNTRNSSWIPLFPPNEPGVYFMECKLLQSGKVISTANVELSVASN
ncbi:TPA: hypothetical protein R1156_004401, partial [Yersinia enterocolitica]|nr:hypothetical protein [Yersinia enterocolitica]